MEKSVLVSLGDSRKMRFFEVLGSRSLSLVGSRFELGQLRFQFFRFVQLGRLHD